MQREAAYQAKLKVRVALARSCLSLAEPRAVAASRAACNHPRRNRKPNQAQRWCASQLALVFKGRYRTAPHRTAPPCDAVNSHAHIAISLLPLRFSLPSLRLASFA
ncbi:hypothetical protein ACQY0O_000691 [Thecaphora frezii]